MPYWHSLVKTLNVSLVWPRDRQWVLLSCSAQHSQSFSQESCLARVPDSGPLFLGLKSKNGRAWVCKRGPEQTQGLYFVLKSKNGRAWVSRKEVLRVSHFSNSSCESLLIFCTMGSKVKGGTSTRPQMACILRHGPSTQVLCHEILPLGGLFDRYRHEWLVIHRWTVLDNIYRWSWWFSSIPWNTTAETSASSSLSKFPNLPSAPSLPPPPSLWPSIIIPHLFLPWLPLSLIIITVQPRHHTCHVRAKRRE